MPYNIVCDDEFLLREELDAPASTCNGRFELFGTILVFGMDDAGELASLTDSDVRNLMRNTHLALDLRSMDFSPCLATKF